MTYWFVCILCLSLLEVGLAKGTHCPSFFCSFFLSFLLLTSFWRKGHYIRWQMFDFSCPGGFSFLELLALLPVFLSSSIEALVIFASGNFCFRLSANCGGNYLEFFRFRDPSLERSRIDNISHSNSNKWRRIEVLFIWILILFDKLWLSHRTAVPRMVPGMLARWCLTYTAPLPMVAYSCTQPMRRVQKERWVG